MLEKEWKAVLIEAAKLRCPRQLHEKWEIGMTGDENTAGSDKSSELAHALPRLTAEEIAQVSPKLVRETYEPGEVIMRQGESPDRFYIIIRGNVEVLHENLSGEISTIAVRKPGEYLGEIGLLKHQPRSATVRAAEESTVELLAMNREDFEELIDESRATESQVAREMIQRLIILADFQ